MHELTIDSLSEVGRALLAGWARCDRDCERAAFAVLFEKRPVRQVANEVGQPRSLVHDWATDLRRTIADYLGRPGNHASDLVISDEHYEEFQDEHEEPSGWQSTQGPDDR